MNDAGARLQPGDLVRHARFGIGKVRLVEGETALVRFESENASHDCATADLEVISSPLHAVLAARWHSPIEVVTRVQAAAIESVNDAWGVLSMSRIDLLPHQLWVCRQVLQTWPTRWLVADDVGLGKTVEAGLILWPLLAKGTVRRLLIVCPASLVEQWSERLRSMFDIRVAPYTPEADTDRTDFWGTHDKVVVSLQTLRIEGNGRQQRLFEGEPWDLVIVDEAHHLNADEKAGPTLGYRLLEKLTEGNRVKSILCFTGTPHRGKNFGFLSLVRLLRPDLFDPQTPLGPQLQHLRRVMIRNNKQNVTDLKGNRLFHPPRVIDRTFEFSDEEREFYEMLTRFIENGQAYASSLDATTGRAVQLVLMSMQKLAASSVAAVRRTLRERLQRIVADRGRLAELEARRAGRRARYEHATVYDEYERQNDLDALSRLEEEILRIAGDLRLMENEEPRLRQLVACAEKVKRETKLDRIVEILRNEFADRPVLLFTEYKATQSLVMSAVIQEFGLGCVGFINGDDRADDVRLPSGESTSMARTRVESADEFNAGRVRFLVSTEAGGEGIDLQERCRSLIHVDLPWNPMRMHQRVGRLNRYGQTGQVEVMVLRNPETVEGRIWVILRDKMNEISRALGHAMDEPEDLFQLVLGMTSPSVWRDLHVEAPKGPDETLAKWFDHRTGQFGNADVLKTVQELVGNCAKFDFQEMSEELPRIGLTALRPFFLLMLRLNRRRFEEKDEGLAFLTPERWRAEVGVLPSYQDLVFRRDVRGRDAARRVLGVGHKLVGQALAQARGSSSSVATLSQEDLTRPLIVFRIQDRLTGVHQVLRALVVGVEIGDGAVSSDALLKDWELLERLNGLFTARGLRSKESLAPPDRSAVQRAVEQAAAMVRARASEVGPVFRVPEVETVAVLWPIAGKSSSPKDDDDEVERDDQMLPKDGPAAQVFE